jgi:hypothetical protein
MLRKYCAKKELLTAGSAAEAKLLITSMHTGVEKSQGTVNEKPIDLTVETNVGNISHRVLDSPDDAVHKHFELWRCKSQKSCIGAVTASAEHYPAPNPPGKQLRLILRRSLKNPTRCSGYSAKS